MTESQLPVIVVSGATGGMGQEIVRDLVRDHAVIALGRSTETLKKLADLGASVRHADLADRTDLEAVADYLADLPRVAGIVHAAATAGVLGAEDAGLEDWNAALTLNTVAPAFLTRAVLAALRRQNPGTVCFIGSGASERPAPGEPLYAASKHALKGFADTLRIDEENRGVRVSTVSPGPTATPMQTAIARHRDGAETDPDALIQPASIAAAVRFVLDAGPDAQIADISVRPRAELWRR